jgi:hypothetical protein
VVGWKAEAMPMGEGEPYTIFNADGAGVGGGIPLSDEHKAQGVPPNWTAFVFVDDCDAAAEKAKSLGGSVMRPARDIPNVGRLAIIADPSGAVMAIMKPIPPAEARPRPGPGTPGHAGWHELYAGDAERDVAFYQQLFGWKETGAFDMGPMGVYHLFGNADGQVGGIMKKPDQMPTAAWQVYFEVDDADRASERVKRAGGSVLQGPMDVPGGSRVLQAVDPQGADFGLIRTKI